MRLLIAIVICLGLLAVAFAQPVVPPFKNGAMVCAYSTSPFTLTTSSFGYVQCDNQGRLQ